MAVYTFMVTCSCACQNGFKVSNSYLASSMAFDFSSEGGTIISLKALADALFHGLFNCSDMERPANEWIAKEAHSKNMSRTMCLSHTYHSMWRNSTQNTNWSSAVAALTASVSMESTSEIWLARNARLMAHLDHRQRKHMER